MGNMNYCRFENTYESLKECLTALQDEGGVKVLEEKASQYEKPYIKRLVEMCRDIADEYQGEGDYNEKEDEYYTPKGFYEWQSVPDIKWKISAKVTHWMPLISLP